MSSPERVPWLVGHEAARAELLAAIAAGRAHHALCLVGPEGIGKARLGRLLGMAFLCPQRTASGPCGECRSCRRLAAGSHPDWHELRPGGTSAQGVISIEAVRSLEDSLWLAPGEGVGRVAFLPAAHRLQEVGQNALLKTLEEPPPGTLFILVTPRPGDLLPTILSRCQVMRLKPLSPEEVARVLRQERLPEGADLETAVALAGGSPGRARRFLEGPGLACLPLVRRLLDAPTHDPFALVAELFSLPDPAAAEAAEAEKEGEAPQGGARGRLALWFLGLLQEEIARRRQASFLAGAAGEAYDPAEAEGWQERCFQAERDILANLDPALVLEVLQIDLREGREPPP